MAIQKIFADREYVDAQINAIPDPIIVEEVTESVYVLESSDIDTTLSVAGKVADAKVVGNKIDLIFEEISKINRDDIIEEVIAALGTPVFGRVDEGNNIILSGNLAEGTYTIKYEDADGSLTVIGVVEIGAEPAYTNILDTVGWQENKRISASSGYIEKDNDGTDLTGYIPVSGGDVIRLKNVTMPASSTEYENQVYFYDSEKTGKGSTSIVPPNYSAVADDTGNLIQFNVSSTWMSGGTGFIRIGAANIDSTSIITVNEPINSDASYTSLADPTSADWLTNKRINSSKNIVDVTEAQRGDKTVVITNYLPLSGVSKFHVKGLDVLNNLVNGSSNNNYSRYYMYDSDKVLKVATLQPSSSNYVQYFTTADYDNTVTIIDAPGLQKAMGYSVAYVRLGGILTGAAEDVVITADENIG